MKKLVQITEIEGEGLLKLMGEQVVLFCANYIYAGKLIGVNDAYVLLEDGKIVYETGSFDLPAWKDAQRVSPELYVMLQSVESFCKGK